MSQQLAPPQPPTITDISQEKDSSLWLKVFLIDSSSNQNDWKASEEHIKKNVQNFVGKPFVLTSDKKHPDFVKEGVVFGKGDETLNQILTAQSKYKIGEIKKVEQSGSQYHAYIQISDPKIIESFKQGNIPKFVSPSVFDPNATPDGNNMGDFSPLHIAAVDEPAYGLKAYVRGACEGDSGKCVNELKEAAAAQPKNPNCPCSILETFTHKFDTKSSSYLKNASLSQDSLSQLEKPETIVAEITPQVETSKLESSDTNTVAQTPQTPEVPEVQAPQPTVETETPKVETRGRKAELLGEVETLKQQLAQVLEWQKGEQEKAVKAAAEQQRATIEAAITPELVGGDDAKRQQVIDNLVGLNFSNEQLNFVLDLIGNKSPKPNKEDEPQKNQAPPQFQKNQVKSASVNNLILGQNTPSPQQKKQYFSSGFFGDL